MLHSELSFSTRPCITRSCCRARQAIGRHWGHQDGRSGVLEGDHEVGEPGQDHHRGLHSGVEEQVGQVCHPGVDQLDVMDVVEPQDEVTSHDSRNEPTLAISTALRHSLYCVR